MNVYMNGNIYDELPFVEFNRVTLRQNVKSIHCISEYVNDQVNVYLHSYHWGPRPTSRFCTCRLFLPASSLSTSKP